MKFLRRFWFKVFPKFERLELRFLPYNEADQLIRESEGKPEDQQWVIAREEDGNTVAYMVYLERRRRVLE